MSHDARLGNFLTSAIVPTLPHVGVADDDRLSFEETLHALLGLIGQPVEIAIHVGARGEPSLSVGFMEGRLTRASNRGPAVMPDMDAGVDAWNNHDAQFFVVGDGGGTGFYLAPQAFRTARWLSPTQHDLWIEQGLYPTVCVVVPRARQNLGSMRAAPARPAQRQRISLSLDVDSVDATPPQSVLANRAGQSPREGSFSGTRDHAAARVGASHSRTATRTTRRVPDRAVVPRGQRPSVSARAVDAAGELLRRRIAIGLFRRRDNQVATSRGEPWGLARGPRTRQAPAGAKVQVNDAAML